MVFVMRYCPRFNRPINPRLVLCVLVVLLVVATRRKEEREGNTGGFAEATLIDHKNLIYALPRPGVSNDEDCYTDIYSDDLNRDLEQMNLLGATTVMTYNGWNFGASHEVLLKGLAKHNLTLGITFKPDLNGVMRKNLEKLRKLIQAHNVTLEYLYLDYPLDFDNAEEFFRWVIQVRSWMLQEELTSPLFIRFFPQVSNPKTVQVLLQQWDEGDFSAWVVEAYSVDSMNTWLTTRMLANKKKIFFLYGSDSWDMVNNNQTLEPQAEQLLELVNYITLGNSSMEASENATLHLLSGAIQGYTDVWYLGSQEAYFQGGSNDVCPDKNPFLHTSCGGSDPQISFGDEYFSVEHMGVMKPFETIYYFRCLQPSPAAIALQAMWNPDATPFTDKPICTLSVSVPTIFIFYMWIGGLAVGIFGLITGCCKSKCKACEKSRIQRKMSKDPQP